MVKFDDFVFSDWNTPPMILNIPPPPQKQKVQKTHQSTAGFFVCGFKPSGTGSNQQIITAIPHLT